VIRQRGGEGGASDAPTECGDKLIEDLDRELAQRRADLADAGLKGGIDGR
jgi:hypothetical protein